MSAPVHKPVYQPYRFWPWIAGLALAAGLVTLLFAGAGGI